MACDVRAYITLSEMCVDEGAQWHGNRLSQKPGKIMKGGIFYKWIHFPNHCSPCRPLPTLLPSCSPEIIYLARAQRPHPSPLQFTVPHHSSALCDWTTLLFRRMIHMRCILFIIRMSERTCKEGKVYSTCCFQTVLEIPPPPPWQINSNLCRDVLWEEWVFVCVLRVCR